MYNDLFINKLPRWTGLKTLFRHFPRSVFLNKVECFYLNNFENIGFKVGFSINGYFKIKLKNGVTLNVFDNPLNDEIGNLEGYLKKYKLRSGNYVIDAGAYIGIFSIYAAKLIGKEGKVIAFEPDKPNFDKLLYNIKLNNLDNITIINKGLWKEDKELKFDSRSNAGSAIILSEDDVKGGVMCYKFVKLDNELKRLGIKKIDFIKMDIEGAELEAIEGCERTLKNNNVNLAIASYHIRDGRKTCEKLKIIFDNMGYESKTEFPKHLTTYASKE